MQIPSADLATNADNRTEKNLLVTVAFLAIIAIAGAWFAMRLSAAETLERDATTQARIWAIYISQDIENFDSFLAGEPATEADYQLLNTAKSFGNVFSYKIYSADGTVTQASNAGDLGLVKRADYFRNIVASGETFARMGKGGFQDVPEVYIEAYVPIIRDGRFVGAIETYVDVTDLARDIERKTWLALVGLVGVFNRFRWGAGDRLYAPCPQPETVPRFGQGLGRKPPQTIRIHAVSHVRACRRQNRLLQCRCDGKVRL